MNTDYEVRYDGCEYYYEHVDIVERVLGRSLKKGEEVHHVDGDKKNNETHNLVVCDRAFHILIERRTKALEVCGNPNWRKCCYCGNYDDPDNMYIREAKNGQDSKGVRHRECHSKAERQRKGTFRRLA